MRRCVSNFGTSISSHLASHTNLHRLQSTETHNASKCRVDLVSTILHGTVCVVWSLSPSSSGLRLEKPLHSSDCRYCFESLAPASLLLRTDRRSSVVQLSMRESVLPQHLPRQVCLIGKSITCCTVSHYPAQRCVPEIRFRNSDERGSGPDLTAAQSCYRARARYI